MVKQNMIFLAIGVLMASDGEICLCLGQEIIVK